MRAVLAVICLCTPAWADSWFVAASASPGGTGLSWVSPYNDLQLALAAAVAGDEIKVAQGTYKPGILGSPRLSTFAIPAGVAVRGGFTGPGTPNPDQRGIATFVTVLSGDLSGNDGSNFVNRADNTFHVVSVSAGGGSTVLDGVTIRGGFTGGVGATGGGAGIRITNASPTIVDCTLNSNDGQTGGGGGIYLSNSFGDIIRCTFIGNRSQTQGGGLYSTASGPSVIDCLFESNIGGSGAGVYSTGGSDGIYTRCTFRTNGGQIGSSSGPGFYENASSSTITSCSFIRNTTGGGGGGLMCMGATFTQVRNCIFIGNAATADGGGAVYTIGQLGHTTMTNCLFSGNRSDLASGTTLFVGAGALADLINCTIVNSGSGQGFGTISGNTGTSRLYNCILWNNLNQIGSGQAAQFFNVPPSVIDHCVIQGWTGSLGGVANSGINPKFMDLDGPDNVGGNDDDNLSLLPGSPCIDAAANSWIPTIAGTDLENNPRFHDDPGTPDTGLGTAPIADTGCYEFQGVTCYANCDLSTALPLLNANDFACFLNAFAGGNTYANCDGSTAVPALNANDFLCFLNRFAAGCT